MRHAATKAGSSEGPRACKLGDHVGNVQRQQPQVRRIRPASSGAHRGAAAERFERIEVKAGDVIIREGAEGDYYYVIESGKARWSA